VSVREPGRYNAVAIAGARMQTDIERWNRKYGAGNPNPGFVPDPLLERCAPLLNDHGLALDIACGVGHNALFLARRGYEVVAVDGSETGLGYARAALRGTGLNVHLVVGDLERFAPPPARFDLVLVVRFLHRPLIAPLQRALKPGGLFIYQTFNTNYVRDRPDFRRDFLLEPGELIAQFRDFEILDANDSPDLAEPQTFVIARRHG
jgi:tellurite methyltransferase